MAEVFVLGGRDVGRSFTLKDGSTAGRAPDCEIRLQDRSISRQHARFERRDGRWIVRDLASRNGLLLHGERVEEIVLGDLDEFAFGELVLRFREEAQAPAAPPKPAPPPPPPPVERKHPGPSQPPRPIRLDDEEEGGFVLEEEIELNPEPEEPQPTPGAKAPAEPSQEERDKIRARILSQGRTGGGFLGGDLAQRPLWVQLLVGLFVLGIGAGLFYLAFYAVGMVRGSV